MPKRDIFTSVVLLCMNALVVQAEISSAGFPETVEISRLPTCLFTIEVHVITFNRLLSLQRLLSSLLNAYYPEKPMLTLHVHVEHGAPDQLVQYLKKFSWPFGRKLLYVRAARGGLITAVSESWYPSSSNNYAILLEDDIEVSPLYYRWLVGSLCALQLNPNPNVFGISLHPQKVVEVRSPRHIVDMNAEVRKMSNIPNMPYYQQLPCSWGAMYFPTHWLKFRDYLTHRDMNATLHIPGSMISGWKDSWKKFYIEFAYVNGYYMLYPNFPHHTGLAKNHVELGQHITEEEQLWRRHMFTVNLLEDVDLLHKVEQQVFKGAMDQIPVFNMFTEPYRPITTGAVELAPSVQLDTFLGFTGQRTESLAPLTRGAPPGNKFLSGFTAVTRVGGPILLSLPQPSGHHSGSYILLHVSKQCAGVALYNSRGEGQGLKMLNCLVTGRVDEFSDELIVRLHANGTLAAYYYTTSKLAWLMPLSHPNADFFIHLHSDGDIVAYTGSGPCVSNGAMSSTNTSFPDLWRDNSSCTPAEVRPDYLRNGHNIFSSRTYEFWTVNGAVTHTVHLEKGMLQVITTSSGNILHIQNISSTVYSSGQYSEYALSLHHMGVLLLRGRNISGDWEEVWRSGPLRFYPQHYALMDSNGTIAVFEGFTPCSTGKQVWTSRPDVTINITKACHTQADTERQRTCKYLSPVLYNTFNDSSKVTLLVSTFSKKHPKLLNMSLHYYSRSHLVAKIAVVWHSHKQPRPVDQIINGKLVYYLPTVSDSLNNRFRPSMLFSTEAVVVMDEDIFVHQDDLTTIFLAWQQNSTQIAGFFPAWSTNSNGALDYLTQPDDAMLSRGPPLMQSKFMLLHRSYFWQYFCGKGQVFHDHVDDLRTGEDLAMNFMVANITKGPATLLVVPKHPIADFGTAVCKDLLHFNCGQLHNKSTRSSMLHILSNMMRMPTGPVANGMYAINIHGKVHMLNFTQIAGQGHHKYCANTETMRACVGWELEAQSR